GREVTSGLLYAVPLLLLTLVAGRAFCAWICPLGTTLDAFKIGPKRRLPPGSWRERPSAEGPAFRSIKHAILIFIMVGALFTSAFLVLLDPLSLLSRSLATSLYPSANAIFSSLQRSMYDAGVLPGLWVWLDDSLRGSVLPYQQAFFRMTSLFLLLFAGIILLNLVAHRFWCRYLCPLGAFFSLLTRAPILKRSVTVECDKCGKCLNACKMGAISAKDFSSDAGECILCLNCQSVCPRNAIRFAGNPLAAVRRYDPSRRTILASLGVGILAIGGFRTTAAEKDPSPWLVRPPGARKDGFIQRCIRCGECMKVCPTQGLQPTLFEAGLEGMWSPILVSRLGPCDWSCTSCGHVCPTGAVEKLNLNDKRQLIIGTAYIDENRCIPWADRRDCIVCQELCPVPDKAIVLEPIELKNNQGDMVTVKRPRVLRKLCIGCGICEYTCPVPNQAAIRVFATGEVVTNTDTYGPISPK
ncbi:MAG: 4Fe-4S dicluster domain-containing protein, partial [Dehalococcoidia bacterium]|nr:4Fe-4S dicluster domain-containing protein [Dehalococcoidia bacterium]